MEEPIKKITTEDKCIDNAEQKLGIKYPMIIRNRLKENNGFFWGDFGFYPVLDEEDKFHTYDDVVRENTNEAAGWRMYLPQGYVAIGRNEFVCIMLNINKDGKIYTYDIETGELEVYANNEEELEKRLNTKEVLD